MSERPQGSRVPSFGEYLKRERELREISLREISDETKVSYRYLEALEEDNAAKLPAEVFIKGFIRSYAGFIGLDADEAILRYQEFQKSTELNKKISQNDSGPIPSGSGNKQFLQMILVLVLIASLVIGALVFAYSYWREGGDEEKKALQQESPSPVEKILPDISKRPEEFPAEVREEKQEKVQSPPKEIPPAVTYSEPSVAQEEALPSLPPLDLTLYALERTWTAVDVDDRQHYDVTLQPGEEIKFRMIEKIRLTVGNAGGLLIRFDGRTFGPLGESGQVIKNFILTREDFLGESEGGALDE